MKPLIRNWQSFPPSGGWSVEYTLEGQSFTYTGSPSRIVSQIRRLLEGNGLYNGDAEIWTYCNKIWCERSPDRCIRVSPKSSVGRTVAGRSGGRGRGCGSC